MWNKIIKITRFIGLWFLSTTSFSQQSRAWPYYQVARGRYSLYNHTPIKRGFIVYKNGDSLKGRIKIPPGEEFISCSILPEGARPTFANVVNVYPKQIKVIRFYDDSTQGKYTDIVSLKYDNKEKLWRLLGKSKYAAIYDDEKKTYDNALAGFKDEDPSKKGYNSLTMILVTGSEIIQIYHRLHLVKPYTILLRFINTRYKTQLEDKDFNTTGDLIKYILEKEDEKHA